MITGSRTVKVLGLSEGRVYDAHQWYGSDYLGTHSDMGYDYLITRATLKAAYSNATTNLDTNQCQVLVNKNMTTIAPTTYGDASNWQTDVSIDWSLNTLPYVNVMLDIGYKMVNGLPKITYLCTNYRCADFEPWSEAVKVGDSYDYLDRQEFLIKKATYADITSGNHTYVIQSINMRTDISYNGSIIHAVAYYMINIEYNGGTTWKLHVLKMMDSMEGDDGDVYPNDITPFAPSRLSTYGNSLPMLQSLYSLTTNKIGSLSEQISASVQEKCSKLYPTR